MIDAGAPEFIIHRRVLTDDGKGTGESLNEVDTSGNGIQFWTTHLLEVLYLGDPFAQSYRNRRVEKLIA